MSSLEAIIRPMRAGWHWWRDELVAAVPQRWRAALADRVPITLIRAEQAGVTMLTDRDGEAVTLVDEGRLDRLDDEAWGVMRQLVVTTRTSLVLTAPDVFTTTLSLPPQGAVALRQTIDLQLERLSPLPPDSVLWHYRIVEAARSAILVRVAMIRSRRLAALEALFAGHNVPLPTLLADSPDGPVTLVKGHDGSATSERRQDRRLVLASLAVLAALPLTAWTGLAVKRAGVEARIEALEDEAASKLRAAARLRSAERDAMALRPLLSRPPASARIAALAAALPEDAALRRLALAADGSAIADVRSADSGALSAALAETFPGARITPAPAGDGVTVELPR